MQVVQGISRNEPDIAHALELRRLHKAQHDCTKIVQDDRLPIWQSHHRLQSDIALNILGVEVDAIEERRRIHVLQ